MIFDQTTVVKAKSSLESLHMDGRIQGLAHAIAAASVGYGSQCSLVGLCRLRHGDKPQVRASQSAGGACLARDPVQLDTCASIKYTAACNAP